MVAAPAVWAPFRERSRALVAACPRPGFRTRPRLRGRVRETPARNVSYGLVRADRGRDRRPGAARRAALTIGRRD